MLDDQPDQVRPDSEAPPQTGKPADPSPRQQSSRFGADAWWLIPGLLLGGWLWWLGVRFLLRLFAG